MTKICPTVTAFEPHEYREQIENIVGFAKYIHIDLMDGEFAPTKSPSLEQIWWPQDVIADIHLMYQRPMDYLKILIKLKPQMVIIHAEADVHHMHFVAELHKAGINVGLAILQDTPVMNIEQIVHSFDHALVFSGNLGHHGGQADLSLLTKVKAIKEHHPEVTIGWDGGISDENARELASNGVDVLNVGGFIQKSEHPEAAYATLEALVENRDEVTAHNRSA